MKLLDRVIRPARHVRERVRIGAASYPVQFWILFWGMLVRAVGRSMISPFLTVYMRESLALSLTTVGFLRTLNSGVGVLAAALVGPVIDRFGRKGGVVLSLMIIGGTWVAMERSQSLQTWIILMLLNGAFIPLYRIGTDTMVADLTRHEQRANAYALLRMIVNVGVAVGPVIGGFASARSYALTFGAAAAANVFLALLVFFSVKETNPLRQAEVKPPLFGPGYRQVLGDGQFIAFCVGYMLAGMAYSVMMVLLPVYAKENFGVAESQYGWIMMVNGGMVVLFQMLVTRLGARYRQLRVLAAGSLVWALGVGSVALGRGFFAFLGSMVVVTLGEMIVMPASKTLSANLASSSMRGKYMGVFDATSVISFGVGPVLGGFLNDTFSPIVMWYVGGLLGLMAAVLFIRLEARTTTHA